MENTAPTPTEPAFDPDAYLAATPPAPVNLIDFIADQPKRGDADSPDAAFLAGLQIVPATVRDAEGFTIEDYFNAAESLVADGDMDTAARAVRKAHAMQRWLFSGPGQSLN